MPAPSSFWSPTRPTSSPARRSRSTAASTCIEKGAAANTLYTIGHSTRPVGELIDLLRENGVDLLVDIRSVPRSRSNPQFNRDALPEPLAAAGISYVHLQALGGLRHHPRGAPPSSNALWQSAAFRNYADYAMTADFRAGLDELAGLAEQQRCAIMCAEAVWWRCHRRIVADYLLVRGLAVRHIMGHGSSPPARLTAGADPQPDGRILYPAAADGSEPRDGKDP